MNVYDKYLTVVMGECVKTFDDRINVGERYRLGIRHNQILKKEVYYIIDVKGNFGNPIYVEIESGYFEEEELNSLSFILS